MGRVDVKQERRKAGLSQHQLSDDAEVKRSRLQLHEQGHLQLHDHEIRRIMIVIKHAMQAARINAAAQEKALAERLREEQEEGARNGESAQLEAE